MTEIKPGFTCYWLIKNFYLNENSPDCEFKSQTFNVIMLRDSTWHLELTHKFSKPMTLAICKEGPKGKSNIEIELFILTKNRWILLSKGPCRFEPGNSIGAVETLKWKEVILDEKCLINGYIMFSCQMSNGATRNKYEQCVMTSEMSPACKIAHKSLLNFTNLKPNNMLNFQQGIQQNVFTSLRYICPLCKTINLSTTKSIQTESMDDVNAFNDLDDLVKLFKDKKFRYVTLRTDSKDFGVQKALLCARSPVFNAMFQGGMKENESNIVHINDIEPETLSLMVQFLHLEPIGDLGWEDAVKLYYAADKYQIEMLKKECRLVLKGHLSDENICEIFIFADTHQDEEIQESAQEYFCKNSKTILRSAEWTDLLFNRADLASKILYKLAENM